MVARKDFCLPSTREKYTQLTFSWQREPRQQTDILTHELENHPLIKQLNRYFLTTDEHGSEPERQVIHWSDDRRHLVAY